jgi:hypothetical protein
MTKTLHQYIAEWLALRDSFAQPLPQPRQTELSADQVAAVDEQVALENVQ